MNKITTSIDQNEITVGIFLDLSKAFDTLDHQILFSKLEHYGIRGIALLWIKSYFSNRKQFVQFNETRSIERIIKCGVPQGSILGPLVFLLYINDLPNATGLAECLLFADDTSIFLSHTDQDYLISTMNDELEKINIWMKTNKLSVNIGKTNYIIFRPKQKSISMNLPILFDTKPIKRVNVVKFLGIFINENISWKCHIDHVCNNISKSIGIISRSRFLLSTRTKLSILTSLLKNVNTPVYFRHAGQPGTVSVLRDRTQFIDIIHLYNFRRNLFIIHSKPDKKNPYNHYDVEKI